MMLTFSEYVPMGSPVKKNLPSVLLMRSRCVFMPELSRTTLAPGMKFPPSSKT